MATDVKVPAAGESISEVFIGTWLKNEGDSVAQDEAIVEVETDKATLEIPSPVAGVLVEQLKAAGDAAAIGEVIARIDESGAAAAEGKPKEADEKPATAAQGTAAAASDTGAAAARQEPEAAAPPAVTEASAPASASRAEP